MFREEGGCGVEVESLERESRGGAGPFLVCRQCLARITPESARIIVDGTHGHVFCNPHGLVFEIGCFSQAPGCGQQGPYVDEFSWFPGHAWRIALCGGCGTLMGWRYRSSEGTGFWGLILSQLQPECDPGKDH